MVRDDDGRTPGAEPAPPLASLSDRVPTPGGWTDRPLGRLKIFVGAAPGVGKTYTMLREAHTAKRRGLDVVVGAVDTHGRAQTARQLRGLEVIAPKWTSYQGRTFAQMDVEAIVRRRPGLVVVDELAWQNVPGSWYPKRYLEVEHLLDLGIDVLTAVNIQHIEQISDEAARVTGVRVRETIPQTFLKRAAEVEVIDASPETIRRRLKDGQILPVDQVEHALHHYFRTANLAALRALVLREVADDVDDRLERSAERRQIPGPVGAKETILVCVNYVGRSRMLIQKAERMAVRLKAELLVLTVVDLPEDSLTTAERSRLSHLQETAAAAGAEYIVEPRDNRALGEVVLDVANRCNVTQIVMGQPVRRLPWPGTGGPVRYLLKHLKYIDLRIVGWRER